MCNETGSFVEVDYAIRTEGEMCVHVWDTTPCRLVYRFDPLGGEYCPHLQGSHMRPLETLVLACQSTRRRIPEEGNLNQHRCGNLGCRREMLRKYYYVT